MSSELSVPLLPSVVGVSSPLDKDDQEFVGQFQNELVLKGICPPVLEQDLPIIREDASDLYAQTGNYLASLIMALSPNARRSETWGSRITAYENTLDFLGDPNLAALYAGFADFYIKPGILKNMWGGAAGSTVDLLPQLAIFDFIRALPKSNPPNLQGIEDDIDRVLVLSGLGVQAQYRVDWAQEIYSEVELHFPPEPGELFHPAQFCAASVDYSNSAVQAIGKPNPQVILEKFGFLVSLLTDAYRDREPGYQTWNAEAKIPIISAVLSGSSDPRTMAQRYLALEANSLHPSEVTGEILKLPGHYKCCYLSPSPFDLARRVRNKKPY